MALFKRSFEENNPQEYKYAIYTLSDLAASYCCEHLLFLASVITDRMQTGHREDIPLLHDALFEEADKKGRHFPSNVPFPYTSSSYAKVLRDPHIFLSSVKAGESAHLVTLNLRIT